MASLGHHKIFPIRISTPFAVGDVFAFLVKDEKIVLVDCGQNEQSAYERVRKALREQELEIPDIDEIWLTHGHPDHFGQAAILADLAGARVLGHRKERTNFAGNDDRELFADFFNTHGIPARYREQMIRQLDWLQQYQQPVEPEWVEEGDMLKTGTMEFSVKHTPGHAPGHLSFNSDEGIIFGGDLLLEHVSTNALINFDPDTGARNASLLQYRQSLQWIREQTGTVLPGHGKFIRDIPAVAGRHLKAHERRYREIRNLLKRRSLSLFQLAAAMFPDAIEQGGVFLVLSEVMGYLDWGIEEKTIEQIEDGGRVLFQGRADG